MVNVWLGMGLPGDVRKDCILNHLEEKQKNEREKLDQVPERILYLLGKQ